MARWRVVVMDGHERSRAAVRDAVHAAGGQVVGLAATASEGLCLVRAAAPDVAIVAPRLAGAEAAAAIAAECPVVLHGEGADDVLVARACRAGVMAYLPGPLRASALGPTLALAIARFSDARELRRRLDERKVVERAKGRLMVREGLTEDEAFRWLRRQAMDSRRPLAVVAREVLRLETLA